MDLLRQRLGSTDINMVKAMSCFVFASPRELDIWSNEYFLQLANMIQFE